MVQTNKIRESNMSKKTNDQIILEQILKDKKN